MPVFDGNLPIAKQKPVRADRRVAVVALADRRETDACKASTARRFAAPPSHGKTQRATSAFEGSGRRDIPSTEQ